MIINKFIIERSVNSIWVYHKDGYFSAADDDWREIIRQVSALLEPEKVEAAPEETPDPRGYVFVDMDGDEWGYRESARAHQGCGVCADRPFKTRQEAAEAGATCLFGAFEIKLWRQGSHVPPMPEVQV